TVGSLHIDSWDVEGTCLIQRARWYYLLGGGVRYVHLAQDYNALLTDAAGLQTVALSHHNFNGAGPIFTLQGRRQISDSCFALYGNLHASVLFGSAGDDFQGHSPTVAPQEVSRHEATVLPIG